MYWAHLTLTQHDKQQHSTAVDYPDSILDKDLKKVVIPIFDHCA